MSWHIVKIVALNQWDLTREQNVQSKQKHQFSVLTSHYSCQGISVPKHFWQIKWIGRTYSPANNTRPIRYCSMGSVGARHFIVDCLTVGHFKGIWIFLFEVVIINIFYINNRSHACLYLKWVACSNVPTEDYQLTLQFPSTWPQHYCLVQSHQSHMSLILLGHIMQMFFWVKKI